MVVVVQRPFFLAKSGDVSASCGLESHNLLREKPSCQMAGAQVTMAYPLNIFPIRFAAARRTWSFFLAVLPSKSRPWAGFQAGNALRMACF